MSDLSDKLLNLVVTNSNEFIEWVKSAAKNVGGEIPLVIQEYLAWNMYSSLFKWIVFGVIPCILFLRAVRFFLNNEKLKETADKEPARVVVSAITLVTAFVFACVNISNITWVKILTAPRVFLIEEVNKFANSATK